MGRAHTPETRARMSVTRIGMEPSAATRAKISESKKGKPFSEAHKAALKKAWEKRDRKAASETCAKMARAKKGKPISDTHRIAVAIAMVGRVFSDEHKANLSKAHIERFKTYPAIDNRKLSGGFLKFGPRLRERDGDLCQLCLKVIDFDLPIRGPLSIMSRTVDHIIPTRLGGLDTLENLWLAHRRCNSMKGAHFIGRSNGTTCIIHLEDLDIL